MLAQSRRHIENLKVQLAQINIALAISKAELAKLRLDHAKLQEWAVATAWEEGSEPMRMHQSVEDMLGTGYTPQERTRTLYNHFRRAFDVVDKSV